MLMMAKMSNLVNSHRFASTPVLPVFVDAQQGGRAGSGSAISVPALSGIADGDEIYAFVGQDTNSAAAATISGFSQVYFGNADTPALTILKKEAASEGGGGYSVAATTSGQASVIMAAYRGGLKTEDVIGTIARSNVATITASSITAVAPGVLLAIFRITADGRTVTTPPAGMTQRQLANSFGTMALFELTPSPAGATGTKALVLNSGGGDTFANLMQIK